MEYAVLISISKSTDTTIILVTHDLEHFLGDRIIFFSKRPAIIIKDMEVSFKKNKNFKLKEDVIGEIGYKEAEKELMKLMRSQSQ